MSDLCEWCEKSGITQVSDTVFWELPDGTKAIEIQSVPSFHCRHCLTTYQNPEIVKDIENQLFIIETKSIENVLTFEDLMNKPRLLKRNYFDFS